MASFGRRVYEFLFVFYCNYGHILYRRRDKVIYLLKIATFHTALVYISLGKTVVNILRCFLRNRATWLSYNMVQKYCGKLQPFE